MNSFFLSITNRDRLHLSRFYLQLLVGDSGVIASSIFMLFYDAVSVEF